MPTRPADLWSHLAPELRARICDELVAIGQEVIREYRRTRDAASLAGQSPHLHPPIDAAAGPLQPGEPAPAICAASTGGKSGLARRGDRKSTRLNSSHQIISY